MLIKNSIDRTARHREKIDAVIGFLGREKYSDFPTINRLFGFKNHRGLYDLLNKLVDDGTLKKHIFGTFRLWSMASADLSKLSRETIRAKLAGQNARFSFEAIGAGSWTNATDIELPGVLKHRPTAVVTLPEGQRAALEIHASIRTMARYKELVKNHLLARKQQAWFTVFFICTGEQQRNAVRMLVHSIKNITFEGQKYPLEAKHFAIFRFITLGEIGTL